MAKPLVVAVLVYASGAPAPNAVPVAGPRAALVEPLRARATVVDHAIDVALADRKAGWRGLGELGFLERGRSALELGRRARASVELEESDKQLGFAEVAYAEGLDEPGVASLAAEAALERGVTLGELGRVEEARAAFRRALDLWPGTTLTERLARPDVVRLFHDAEKLPHDSATEERVPDDRVAKLEGLRTAPSQDALEVLREALGLDSVIVVASSSDGTRLLAARVDDGCSTPAREVDATSIARVLDDPCSDARFALRTDDPRLATAPVALVVAHPLLPHKEHHVWLPWVVAGASLAGLAIIGVAIGFSVKDSRYTVHATGF